MTPEEREAVRGLIAALPKCETFLPGFDGDQCGRPATRTQLVFAHEFENFCDDHAPITAPAFGYASALRKVQAMLGPEDQPVRFVAADVMPAAHRGLGESMNTEESKQQARIALAAKALEESVPSVRHVFSIDGKVFLTWEDVEKAVSVALGVTPPTATNIADLWHEHFEPANNIVFSCYGIQHGDDVYPLGVNHLFAVAEWSDSAIKWTLAPPGANEPVFTKGKPSDWF